MIDISLRNNNGFRWFCSENIYVKGYIFDQNNQFLTDQDLVEYFQKAETPQAFKERLLTANGSFAVVLQQQDLIMVAVDRLRSIPLFYEQAGENFYISDDAFWLREKLDAQTIDPVATAVFLQTGYTLGAGTLLPSIKQIQAGEFVYIHNQTLRSDFYYQHIHGHYLWLDDAEYFQSLAIISKRIFERLIQSVQGQTIVIPLSGGYDSRYIVGMLKKLGYEKVVCYTYGRAESFEVRTSQKVASTLGYKWHFVEYTQEKWAWYFNSPDVAAYNRFASNLCSLPHVQEFLAVRELRDKGIIPDNSIFVPGFCGDLLGGSYVPQEILDERPQALMKEGIARYLYRRHFTLKNIISENDLAEIRKKIADTLLHFPAINVIDDFISVNEAWFTNHKVAKFVVNALRPYEFFNYGWRMPLWDNELMEFWYRIPLKYRQKDKLYERYLFKSVFEPLKINYIKPQPSVAVVSIKDMLKKLLPASILHYLYANTHFGKYYKDFNSFSYLDDLLRDDLMKKGIRTRPADIINQNLSTWFINNLPD